MQEYVGITLTGKYLNTVADQVHRYIAVVLYGARVSRRVDPQHFKYCSEIIIIIIKKKKSSTSWLEVQIPYYSILFTSVGCAGPSGRNGGLTSQITGRVLVAQGESNMRMVFMVGKHGQWHTQITYNVKLWQFTMLLIRLSKPKQYNTA